MRLNVLIYLIIWHENKYNDKKEMIWSLHRVRIDRGNLLNPFLRVVKHNQINIIHFWKRALNTLGDENTKTFENII
jgi:hypothetical protein